MLWIKNKNTSDYFTILTKECLKKYGQQYLPVTVAGDDGTPLSNNRTRARGGSRFFRDFVFLGGLDQQNILGTAYFSRTRFPVKVVLKSAFLKCTEHSLVLFVTCRWTRS